MDQRAIRWPKSSVLCDWRWMGRMRSCTNNEMAVCSNWSSTRQFSQVSRSHIENTGTLYWRCLWKPWRWKWGNVSFFISCCSPYKAWLYSTEMCLTFDLYLFIHYQIQQKKGFFFTLLLTCKTLWPIWRRWEYPVWIKFGCGKKVLQRYKQMENNKWSLPLFVFGMHYYLFRPVVY